MTAFKYQHILEAMAERAKVSETPWDVVQANNGDCWQSLTGMPIFKDQIEYRLKPETKAIDWSQVGDNVPIEVWDGPLEFCFQLGWRTMPTVSRWKDRSLETGRWVFNYGGVNPWPEGVVIEVTFRAADNRNEMVAEASLFRWGLGGREDDIIASRCVGLAKGWTYEEGE